ncbi:ATP-binding cassette domain-containing protein [Serratia marcescens]|uniref:ATP-binding cassette domain-containing protein n=1 Tax=Serratia marcescens TaxID=615 RepID=UPI003FA7ED2D
MTMPSTLSSRAEARDNSLDIAGPSGIQLDRVSVSYRGTEVLKPLTLTIAPGEVLALIGPSGSGKTTVLRAIAGFVQPSAGRIAIGDVDVTDMPPYERGLGMVVQNYALFPHMRVEDNVAIARAIAVRPKVLLLDEPLSALDAQIRHSMVEEIARLHRELPELTILYVTHDQGEALTLADKIGIMRDGHLIAHGETRALYRHPTNRFAAEFLGRANLLPATALETTAGQGMTTVSCAGKVIGCFTYGAQRGFDKLLCIRPQHIALDADAQRSNCIVGTLRDIHWQGELTHLQFDAQGHPLRVVTTHQSRMPQIGERVPLYFAPDDAVLIED